MSSLPEVQELLPGSSSTNRRPCRRRACEFQQPEQAAEVDLRHLKPRFARTLHIAARSLYRRTAVRLLPALLPAFRALSCPALPPGRLLLIGLFLAGIGSPESCLPYKEDCGVFDSPVGCRPICRRIAWSLQQFLGGLFWRRLLFGLAAKGLVFLLRPAARFRPWLCPREDEESCGEPDWRWHGCWGWLWEEGCALVSGKRPGIGPATGRRCPARAASPGRRCESCDAPASGRAPSCLPCV